MTLRTSFGLAAIGVVGLAHAWTSYDFESSFGATSPSHGPFSYGLKATYLDSALQLFTTKGSQSISGNTLEFWWNNDGSFSRIYRNPSDTNFDFLEGTILPAKHTMLHPDNNKLTCVRFTGTAGKDYQAVYRWTRWGASGDVRTYVVANQILVGSALVNAIHTPGDWKYASLQSAASNVIDFSVDQNGPTGWDSTGLELYVYELDTAPITIQVSQPDFVGDLTGRPTEMKVIAGKFPIAPATVAVTGAGNATYACPYRGAGSIWVKPKYCLARVFDTVVTDSGASLGTQVFTSGDIDNDNAITVFDYSVLSEYFDFSDGSANWTVVGSNGFAPRDADIDGDGAVTVFDYSILSDNFDLVGE